MKVTYIGTPDDNDTEAVFLFGKEFPRGEAVDVSDLSEEHQTKLAGNPTFLAGDGSDPSLDTDTEVPIPDGWSDLHWKTRCVLAAKISGSPVLNALEADQIIDDEQARRSKAVVDPVVVEPDPVEPATSLNPGGPNAPDPAAPPVAV